MLEPACRHTAVICLTLIALTAQAATAKRSSAPEIRTGIYRSQPVAYSMINGRAIYQGDILLEHVDPVMRGSAPSVATRRKRDSVGLAYSQYLWPRVQGVAQVPYVIDPASGDLTNIQTAIGQFNTIFSGVVQWVQHTNETNWVDIDLNAQDFSGQCEATEGDAGIGEQMMTGSGSCAVGTILHEMGHVVGLWHEQSRADRDTYLTVNYQNIIKGSRFNFDTVQDDVQNLTLYDYASIMEYPAWVETRNGAPAIESIPAGIPLSSSATYTAADVEGVLRLYGAPPSEVTVTSNPAGLQVLVDGNLVTTPQVFNWTLNSQHTLDVPINVQTQTGYISGSNTQTTFYYTYGRWNDSTEQGHTITVNPGNGELPFPATSPQVATYTANFIQLVPYTASVYPANSGNVAVAPSPQGYPGVSGVYFVARQPAVLTATPANGYNFYEFNNAPFWLPGGLGANPKTFFVPDTGNPVNTTAEFSPSPIYTVDVTPETFSANLYTYVDGTFWTTPKNFSSYYDSGWTVGSSHALNIDSDEYPFSANSRYAFSSWSDGGAQSHTINSLPSSSTSYVATVIPEFRPADNWTFGPPCGGATQTISPTSSDGFYPTGQVLTFGQTPANTWTFAGWTYDLMGLTSPQNLTLTDEVLVFANYNTTNTILTMTSLNPQNAASGGSGFTLTLKGTGFTNTTQVWVDNTFRSSTFVNSTTLQVPITAQDIAAVGAFQVFVQNFPAGWSGCSVNAALPFFVYQGTATAFVTASPSSLTFAAQAVGTTSSVQAVTLKNSGTANTPIAISASGDFGQTDNCGGTLNAGASCQLNVTFSPTAVGSINGAVTVSDSAANSPQIVNLTGKALSPITLAPTTLGFGTVTVGKTSAAKTATLTNNLNRTLTFALSASADYNLASGTTCGTSLPAGGHCTIAGSFSPTFNGSINGAVTVSYNGLFSPVELGLSGIGKGGATTPLTFSPAKLSFASQATGTTSAPKAVTVKNASGSNVRLSGLAASGDYSAAGSGAKPCGNGAVLKPKGTCTMAVRFAPSLKGTIKGGVAVSDNSAVTPQSLNVSGTAVLPVAFSPASLTFSAQTVGTTSAPQTVTMVNNLSTTLTALSIAASGDYRIAGGGSNNCGSSLGAHSRCTFAVTFTPSQKGSVIGAVTVTDSASTSPQVVNLTGTGQ